MLAWVHCWAGGTLSDAIAEKAPAAHLICTCSRERERLGPPEEGKEEKEISLQGNRVL